MTMLGSLLKAAVGVVTLPVDLVADVLTVGGVTTDKPRTYTGDKCRKIMRNLAEATAPERPG
jgi:hypothetical protein